MKRLRNLVIVVAALVLVVGLTITLERGRTKTPVTLQRVTLTTFSEKLPESGVLQRPQTETIPALVAGNIAQLYARAGESVTAGQLLAVVYNPTLEYSAAGSRADYLSASANVDLARVQERNAKVGYQGQVETAKSNLDEAQRIYDADAELYKNQAIPRQQLDQDKAKFDQAKVTYDQAIAQLKLGAVTSYAGDSIQSAVAAAQKARIINDQNQQQLAFSRIVAPFDGVIQTVAPQTNDSLRPIQAGDAVTAGQSLFTIALGRTFIVRTKVDEQDIARVAVGQDAIVSGEDFGGATFPGRVVAIAPTAQKSDDPSATTKQVLTVIALERIAPFMKDGMSADVDILTTVLHHVLVVPNGALVAGAKAKKYVWVVAAGRASKRAVTIGKSNETSSVVRSGLRPGESIVLAPSPVLTQGAAVTIATPSPSPSPM
ncbi:MAG: efflux RND transporter periplasmic adaptor subunit [Candidatus Cybelea sp.]